MTKFVLATLILFGGPILSAQAQMGVNADPNFPYYPWCSVTSYSKQHSGRSCGFVSYQQCQFSIRGELGAICVENTWQSPPYAAARSRKR